MPYELLLVLVLFLAMVFFWVCLVWRCFDLLFIPMPLLFLCKESFYMVHNADVLMMITHVSVAK